MLLRWLERLFGVEMPKESNDEMKYLITGLGNMGAEYDNTRHNIGFEVVDHLARAYKGQWKNEQHGDIASIRHRGRTFVLLKPSTFMNLSGKAVRYWLQKEKINKERLLVIVDDLHLDLGTIRLRKKGSDGGHNGLKSIDQVTGGNNYARLRLGIGNDFYPGQQVEYVLGNWSNTERIAVDEMISQAADAVLDVGAIGLSRAMDKHNGKPAKGDPKK